MIPPFPDKEQWLGLYSQLFGLLFERNLGDDLVGSFLTEMQEAWLRALSRWDEYPERLLAIQNEWNDALGRFNDSIRPEADQRQALKNLKLLHAKLGECLTSLIRETPGISNNDQRLLLFGARHLINAVSPEYWPVTNNEVIETFFHTGGASLMQGFRSFQDDVQDSVIGLDIKTAGKDDFKIGETLAITPGEVIFENRLFQLIQYYPFSQEVYKAPILIVPPWINKYYVLDLTPTDSFVQWCVRQGYTVYMISWINPDDQHSDLTLTEYLLDGCITAVEKIRESAGNDQVNIVGYCIGGLLAACACAYLAGKQEKSIRSLTLLNTMLDHSEPGDIGVFLGERTISALEKRKQDNGILDGRVLRQTFSMLREDRMFWPYVVNNYLLGRQPKPDPVLYWNQDATNLPLAMLMDVIKNMYRDNALVNSHEYALAGEKMNIYSIDIPVFLLACKHDHIVPWKSAYKTIAQLGGEVDFVLSDGGHVMGVINPPNKNRRGYWRTTESGHPDDPDNWINTASEVQGSWWNYWHEWISHRQDGRVRARFPGEHGTQSIESAPGRYVKKTI